MRKNDNPRQSILGVGFFYDEKRNAVLLQLRDGSTSINPHKWGLFGGHMESGEDPLRCFIREMKEELGVEVRPQEVEQMCDYENIERQLHRYVFCVRRFIPPSKIRLQEGAGFAWIPLDRVLDYDLSEMSRRDLETFMQSFRRIAS